METRRLNFKLSQKQHAQLKQLAEHHGLTMTTWLQVQIINSYDKFKHEIQKEDGKQINQKQINIFNQAEDVESV